MLDKIGFAENFEMLYFVFCFFKGDGGLKILQKEKRFKFVLRFFRKTS